MELCYHITTSKGKEELKEMALQIALAIREEVLELEENGINIIQVDEAALKEKLPLRKNDWHYVLIFQL